jgi:hypothetical protein
MDGDGGKVYEPLRMVAKHPFVFRAFPSRLASLEQGPTSRTLGIQAGVKFKSSPCQACAAASERQTDAFARSASQRSPTAECCRWCATLGFWIAARQAALRVWRASGWRCRATAATTTAATTTTCPSICSASGGRPATLHGPASGTHPDALQQLCDAYDTVPTRRTYGITE